MAITKQEENNANLWNLVIQDAETEIVEARRRITALKASIRLFRKKMEDGDPLPDGLRPTTQN